MLMPLKRYAMRPAGIGYNFKTPAFGFMFQWVLGMQTSGGAEIGEAYHAASLVRENDPKSWVTAWTTVARQVEQRAEQALAAGHAVSAREAYLRAYVYNRAALMGMGPFDTAAEPTWHHAVDCFRRSAALMEAAAEPVLVPCGGAYLPGYFVAPDDGQAKRKTLIAIGGVDTYVEDLYLLIGPAAIRRGYNLLIVDLPGQGGLPFERLYMQPDTENQIPAIVEYALSRPEVDYAGLAAYGIGYGGYMLARALSVERRIRAATICSVLSDFHAWMIESPISHWVARKRRSLLAKAIVRTLRLRPSLILMDTYAWRWGVKTYAELLDIIRGVSLGPAPATCPLLSIVGEQGFQDDAVRASQDPDSRLLIVRASDGWGGNALGTNLSLTGQLVFDWLDEVLSTQPSMPEGIPA